MNPCDPARKHFLKHSLPKYWTGKLQVRRLGCMNKHFCKLVFVLALSGCGIAKQTDPWSVVKEEPSQTPATLGQLSVPRDAQERVINIQDGINKCGNMVKQGLLKTYVAYFECTTSYVNQACASDGCQYPDLIKLASAKKIEVAERLDENKMTVAQCDVAFAQIDADMVAEANKRDIATSNAIAQISSAEAMQDQANATLLDALKPNMQPPRQRPDPTPTTTNCNMSGNYMSCQSY